MFQKFKDEMQVAKAVAARIAEHLERKPDSLICIAGGDTPKRTMQEMIRMHQAGEVDFSKAYFVGLDEWVGLGRETHGSCVQTLYDGLFEPLELRAEQICFFDGKATDLKAECARINTFIAERGGIDFILLGVGMNGHIGFNEPGIEPDQDAHIVPLDSVTKEVMSKYFETDLPLTQGISLGMRQILAAQEIIVIATGAKKADIMHQVAVEAPTAEIPATLLKPAQAATFYLDEAAGARV
ncbi:glucosamine-6-phosphate deaminase [Listeria ilorinensis]|uniref:glucosamine-6-phosphate deaminase n=1 Tax=Listeria ilorinensis TaxID=2867439 RepID=UPI001EF6A8B1|nr:glucosamine-6-phosphate deaminase [Listeria ilorinensis]